MHPVQLEKMPSNEDTKLTLMNILAGVDPGNQPYVNLREHIRDKELDTPWMLSLIQHLQPAN